VADVEVVFAFASVINLTEKVTEQPSKKLYG
jgi:hypothetical protein